MLRLQRGALKCPIENEFLWYRVVTAQSYCLARRKRPRAYLAKSGQQPRRQLRPGDWIKANLPGRIVSGTIRSVVTQKHTCRLEIEFGNNEVARIWPLQVLGRQTVTHPSAVPLKRSFLHEVHLNPATRGGPPDTMTTSDNSDNPNTGSFGTSTALLINCSRSEAQEVRRQAKCQRGTVSAYVINTVMRYVETDDQLFAKLQAVRTFRPERLYRSPGGRTTMFLSCSVREATRIRNTARRQDATISGFVLRSLRRSWEAALTQ